MFCPFCGRRIRAIRKRSRRPNGAGSVSKLSGKREKPWQARVQIKGVRHVIGNYKTEVEAMRAVELFDSAESAVKETITFKEVWDIINERKTEGASYEKKRQRDFKINALKSLWDKEVRKLRAEDYQKALDSITDKYASTSISNIRSVISEVCGWCLANELIKFNPTEFITTPKGKDKVQTKNTFSEEDIEKLWADNSETAHIVLALIYTGLRIEELFSLKPNDVHIDENGFNYLVGGEKTEAGKNRTVVIHHRVLPFFKQWKANGNAYLLANSTGSKIIGSSWRKNKYYPMLERLNIEAISPHKARHTFATRIAAAGGNTSTLQKTIGHSNYSTTANIYTHPSLDSIRDLVELQK